MPMIRLRPLAVMILALLREGDMHPYEMMRLLTERRGNRLLRLQKGTFYHQVAALERDGLIAEAGVKREGNRPERTLYTIRPEGMAAVATWVRAHLGTGSVAADFPVALAESHNLERDEVCALLGVRLDALRTERDDVSRTLRAAEARHVDRQYTIELERVRALLDADVSWTESFVEELAAGSLSWGSPSPAHLSSGSAAQAASGKENA